MPLSNEDRRKKIEEHKAMPPSAEALARKARSIERLKKEAVPFNDHLPVIEDSAGAKIRTVQEVCERAIAVCMTAAKGEGIEQNVIDAIIKKLGASPFFTPKERAFITNPNTTQVQRAQFSWRYECYWVLLWALGYLDTIGRPEKACDVPRAVDFLRHWSTPRFISGARLRPVHEILDEADLVYRYHWAIVDARVKNLETPAGLDKGVVKEWHYALNWLIGYMDQEWDDISTDT
jgi:hypothetical protein